ncbi:MAG: hypothetical protein SFU99_08355 [Saprospiraceae bacterium]|nr:hypothetical protein [Saprospiraceae bacterium]
MDRLLKGALLFPAIFAVGYVIPFLPKRKRLRDLHYIKIFLIVVCWSFVTVVLPVFENHVINNIPMSIMAMERSCYIFALAMLFDIRDVSVDKANRVHTIPEGLGINRAKVLAYLALVIMVAFAWLNFRLDAYTLGNFLSIGISGILSAFLVYFSSEQRSDYFFCGLVDGMLLLQLPLILLL